jgi:hypothetical protein
MYPKELEIKEKLEKASSLPFLEIYLKFYINAQLKHFVDIHTRGFWFL